MFCCTRVYPSNLTFLRYHGLQCFHNLTSGDLITYVLQKNYKKKINKGLVLGLIRTRAVWKSNRALSPTPSTNSFYQEAVTEEDKAPIHINSNSTFILFMHGNRLWLTGSLVPHPRLFDLTFLMRVWSIHTNVILEQRPHIDNGLKWTTMPTKVKPLSVFQSERL